MPSSAIIRLYLLPILALIYYLRRLRCLYQLTTLLTFRIESAYPNTQDSGSFMSSPNPEKIDIIRRPHSFISLRKVSLLQIGYNYKWIFGANKLGKTSASASPTGFVARAASVIAMVLRHVVKVRSRNIFIDFGMMGFDADG